MDAKKLYIHHVGDFEVRCPFAEPDAATELWDTFLPAAKMLLHKLDKAAGQTALVAGLPEIRGVGVPFRGELLTAYGEGFAVTFLDSTNLSRIAAKISERA
jgi:hypothetical protein